MATMFFYLTQVQEFTEVLPDGRWARCYMLPGTVLMRQENHPDMYNHRLGGPVLSFRVYAAPLFYDAPQGEEGPLFSHWTGWVYLPREGVALKGMIWEGRAWLTE